MGVIEAVILGILQGLTEFLPVSSSGHLVIGSEILGLKNEENLTFAIAVHAATVLSTITILHKDILNLLKGLFKFQWNEETQYVAKICLSLIPVMIVGLFFKDQVEELFSSGLLIVGIMLLVTAVLLAFSYYAKPRPKENLNYKDAFIIGLAQGVAAIFPGLSRSGSTIATGLLLGNNKETVAKFSFLMVLIPILGEAFLDLVKGDFSSAETSIPVASLIAGFLAAFIFGCLACKWMINLVKKGKLIYFAYYCAIVGTIAIVYSIAK
ncbi:undecaprenyl-diphosphate phosphatase [Dysgonomonas sp. 520]|uniref:undecaprenyl-diphosphate phosphatase n=1 Tax=Dysgonomonas sp. 520 TaxID=2302931 RepID=UPI0013D61514|nr:undecaprenyl-diphosphate phosphatase [Dysgonomonas sp. 520]NDW11039.1 undecaprenyl-diphosphate phosphatase [Dysgonomonas sp. 520]